MESVNINTKIKSYRDLLVWQKSLVMVKDIYQVTAKFPKQETYGLAQQMQRSAISIPSNIAEGSGRDSSRELCHFLDIAYGSLMELETQLEISALLNYLDSKEKEKIFIQTSEVGKMINGLIRNVRQKTDH